MAVNDELTNTARTITTAGEGRQRPGGVQSIERAFSILEALAGSGGVMGLSALAAETRLPLPTIHRLARTLIDLGYLRQEPSRQYALGPRVLLLAESSSTMLSVVARPHLARLVDELGETANLASLDGDQILYLSQVPSRHSMRMFTEVGRRVLPHCTAVGKAIMADMPAHHHRPRDLYRPTALDGRTRLRDRRRRAGTRRALRRRRRPRCASPSRVVRVGSGRPDDTRDSRPRRAAADLRRTGLGRRAGLTGNTQQDPAPRRGRADVSRMSCSVAQV